MDECEDVTCPLCKHEMSQQHMQIVGVYGYITWWDCDWCGYSTHPQEHIFTAKDTKRESEKTMGKVAKDATLHEIIAWCEREADKQSDMYREDYGDKQHAIAARGAYWAVAAHCRGMLG